jgi:exodeoxyribonuclease V beta subunit
VRPLRSDTFPLSGYRLIEASAGTGKTYTITNLYLRLLLGQGDPGQRPLGVDEILVLTFTIAATEELRARIRRRITEARDVFRGSATGDEFLTGLTHASQDAHRDVSLLTAALQLMDEASIFTIHGFCARVLADNAFETGTLFDQNLDGDRDVLLETAVQDCFRNDLLTLPDRQRRLALDTWGSPQQLINQLKPFLFRQNLSLMPPTREVDEADLSRRIDQAKRLWLTAAFPAFIESAGIKKTYNAWKKLGAMTEFCESTSYDTQLWTLWTSVSLADNFKSGYDVPTHPLISLIDSIKADQDQIPINLWHLVVTRVRGYLDAAKRAQSELTLDDLLTRVHEALEQPEVGPLLVDSLSARWPIAMVDEFQDTDDTQYSIFGRIYRHRGLFLIGDPKQAIYQFRGADVFTYVNARRELNPDSDLFSLATNWRSTAPMVEAINTLFSVPSIFGDATDITYEPASPSATRGGRRMTDRGNDVMPVELCQLTGATHASQLRRLAAEQAAETTSHLLEKGQRGDLLIDGKPVHAGQIAFLVRSGVDARAVRDALRKRQIRSVYVTLESVFLTETADDLRTILQAVLEPTNERALRAALAVPLMQSTAAEIHALSTDVQQQQTVLQEFADYHRLWARLDVATMIQEVMIRRHIASKWFGQPDGERQITNLRHLIELLQRRAAAAPGMHRLLKWFTREKRAAERVAAEERQLRLESDRNLVQIVTMHAAKGLEYEIVMIPMAGFVAPSQSRNGPALFHTASPDGQFGAVLDFGNSVPVRALADEEQLAEDMRLLYVAITRAIYQCHIGIPNTKGLRSTNTLPKSALAKLLRLTDFLPDEVDATLTLNFQPPQFRVSTVVRATVTPFVPTASGRPLVPPPSMPTVDKRWRLHSYTGVSRLISRDESDGREADVTPGYGDDDTALTPVAPIKAREFSRFTFPRGPRAGVALHTLLERIDFTTPLDTQTDELTDCLDRIGLTQQRREWLAVLTGWIGDVLTTPLPGGATLSEIPRTRRLDEMEFHFPLHTDGRLLTVLKSADYSEHAIGLRADRLEGVMTGLIDLVFGHDGRFWLVDYKSNHLGNTTTDYDRPQLQQAIDHHQYDLQYLIYSVALHRYLRTRVPGYTFDSHFGGVCYLFLRGMAGPGKDTGVYFHRPEEGFIDQLDAVLDGPP